MAWPQVAGSFMSFQSPESPERAKASVRRAHQARASGLVKSGKWQAPGQTSAVKGWPSG
jgi:hypothetical protein